MDRLAAVAAAFAILLAAAGLRLSPAEAAPRIHSLEYRVLRADGGEVWLQFEVAAANEADAQAAALRAVAEIAPGGRIADLHERDGDDGSVRAAYASWPWLWDASELPVAVWYAPAGAPAGTTEQAIKDALTPWSSVPASSFAYRYAGESDRSPGVADRILDGRNTVGWRSLDCSQGCVLGVTSKVPEAHEVDIMLNSNPAAGIGDGSNFTVDLTTVLLHEAGHMAGLEHSCVGQPSDCSERERQAVMYFRYQGVKRTLEADDMAGIAALYPGGRQVSVPSGLALDPSSAQNHVIRVVPGWNLAVLPEGWLSVLLRDLPCVDSVWGQTASGWQSWQRTSSTASELVRADGKQAYWLVASAECSAVLR